jgi:starvation-inducible outer membrane lipoprotein
MNKHINNVLIFMLAIILSGCGADDKKLTEEMKDNLDKFREVTLTTDLSWLSSQEKEIITILIDVAAIMDDIFWLEAYGD